MGSGGGGTTIYTPSPAPQPSSAEAIQAWIEGMPQVYQTQMQYAPLQAAQQVQLAQQYALPMGQAQQAAMEAMYPGTAALQETMSNQALQGMTATQMPDWMRQQYTSDINANLGTNIGSGIGAEYLSRNMQQQLYNQQSGYRDLGLSLSNRQPLAQATMPQTADYMGGYTPGSTMGYMAQNYGNYTQAQRPVTLPYQQGSPFLWGLLGNIQF